MKINDLIEKLNDDLSREYSHFHFYLNASMRIVGLHREELKEFLLKEASGEMKHISEFGDVIVGLNGVPVVKVASFEHNLTTPEDILEEALKMESEVVENYVQRMDDCDELEKNGGQDKVDARYVHLFLEDQMIDSRKAVDELTQMLN